MSELRDAFDVLIDLPAHERERRLQAMALSEEMARTLRFDARRPGHAP